MLARPKTNLLQFILNKGSNDDSRRDDESSSNSLFFNSTEASKRVGWTVDSKNEDQGYNRPRNSQLSSIQATPRAFSPYLLNTDETSNTILDNLALMKNEPVKNQDLNCKDSKRRDGRGRAACLRSNSGIVSNSKVRLAHLRT